jgi:hypothetical protein
VEKSSEKKVKKRTCYICHEKGHISYSSKPIITEDVYSLCKDKVGNVFAKFVGTQRIRLVRAPMCKRKRGREDFVTSRRDCPSISTPPLTTEFKNAISPL